MQRYWKGKHNFHGVLEAELAFLSYMLLMQVSSLISHLSLLVSCRAGKSQHQLLLYMSNRFFFPCLCLSFSAQNASPCPIIVGLHPIYSSRPVSIDSHVLQEVFLLILKRVWCVLFPANPHNTCYLFSIIW